MSISLRLSEEDTALIKNYADMNGMTISELFRKTVLEKIEDEYDLAAYNKAMASYRKNPKTYTLDEVEKELKLS